MKKNNVIEDKIEVTAKRKDAFSLKIKISAIR